MATFMATTASSGPRLRDPSAVRKVLERFRAFGDLELRVVEETEDAHENGRLVQRPTGVFRLHCWGYDWPDVRQVPAGVDPRTVDEDDERLVWDALEELLQSVAPYLEEPFVVQAVGSEKCRYPLAACEWSIQPGGTKAEVTGFKHG